MRSDKPFIVFVLFGIICLILTNFGCARKAIFAERPSSVQERRVPETPADEKIKKAKEIVQKNPEVASSHNDLASAYLKKVRETGNYSFNRNAEKAIDQALQFEPGNYLSLALKAQIYLSEHDFDKALETAKQLIKDRPNEITGYLAMTDANTELGNYEEAVRNAQRLVDMRPNSASYTRVAHLRSLYGDTEGALEARKLALRIADPDDKEGLAWHHSQIGKELFETGKFVEAEREFDLALKIFPEYHWALAGKGKVRAAQNDLRTASDLFEKLNKRNSEPERAIFLGDIYKKLGKEAEAKRIYDEIAKKQRNEDGDMHRIALFWADHDMNLDEALMIAREDRKNNADLLSSDTLAWCLYRKENYKEAKMYIAEAMRLKTKSALFYYHAGMIENALGNRGEALKYLNLSVATNPSFDLLQAEIAKRTLSKLEKGTG